VPESEAWAGTDKGLEGGFTSEFAFVRVLADGGSRAEWKCE
jgi:hypothetical protein